MITVTAKKQMPNISSLGRKYDAHKQKTHNFNGSQPKNPKRKKKSRGEKDHVFNLLYLRSR